ncbi:Metallo-dependent hydrolase [Phlegmacium glaucopus]|nr:Metallo-dependent hydrolase [Phlegmacium glaucopus]
MWHPLLNTIGEGTRKGNIRLYDFVRTMYEGRNVESIVDVWCEAPTLWGGLEYWFVIGVHPHDAKSYNDQVEKDIIEAIAHPRCVGWGEMGLDYHYDNSPRDIQQRVFVRQLRQAVKLAKPLTVHTREADEDTLRILKEEATEPTHLTWFLLIYTSQSLQ